MRVITRLFIIIFFFVCICYYFDIDMKGVLGSMINIIAVRNQENTQKPNETVHTDKPEPPKASESVQDAPNGYSDLYEEIIGFIKNQKKGRNLVESYRVLDKTIGGDLKGRSYIKDNCLAAIALLNHGDTESESIALEILKNLSSVQNGDGSWNDFYDISGEIGKVSGKDYKESDTGYNALALYTYSYYTIMTGDRQFKDTMKKSADFIISRRDEKNGGIYDGAASENGLQSVRTNTYAYFGIREYALAIMPVEYEEYKARIYEADKIASWVLENCMDKQTFIKGYTGKEKVVGLNLDSQLLGAFLINSTNKGEKAGYGIKELDAALSKLYKNISGLKGYAIDNDDKNQGFIWCEGTCKMPLVVLKLDGNDRCSDLLEYIDGYLNLVSKTLVPRGIPYSTNVDNKINMVNLESVSTSAWAAIAIQCSRDEHINNAFLGREEYVFKIVK